MQAHRSVSARGVALALLLAPALLVTGAGPADARKMACKKSEVPIADDREGGGNLCISKKERARAKAICKANGSSNWLECTCQDADTVAACGD